MPLIGALAASPSPFMQITKSVVRSKLLPTIERYASSVKTVPYPTLSIVTSFDPEKTRRSWDTESYPSATKVADAASAPIVTSPEAYWEKR